MYTTETRGQNDLTAQRRHATIVANMRLASDRRVQQALDAEWGDTRTDEQADADEAYAASAAL